MNGLSILTWILALAALLAGIAVCIAALRLRRPRLALLSTIPLALGLAGIVFDIDIPAPTHLAAVLCGLVAAALGVIGGNPITVAVLEYADSRAGGEKVTLGSNGGILESVAGRSEQREVLRGGTTIGYLERIVVIAAIATAHWEIVAVLVAIKGLGRFRELDSPQTRERFIIGTLVSMVWAGACAALFAL
ncbi:hypothetical protein [Lacisediminihabitans changchengi]|uniref:Uncharacterized protein n=1 Tax=Lacisediminihabitans changchengi TaxID=2787634 RepID=A0A934W380_9MICO|nr:hypothetical protein [Lacisediminihabitans changchengi]MBK4347641.1 hypothetical protein [Lacisediminihabitans changchengi]